MMKLWQIGLVSVSMGVALPAVAQMVESADTRSGIEARIRERLGRMDANKDGTVSPEEMRGFADARIKARDDAQFAMMDTDKNGSISRAEFDAYRAGTDGKGDRVVRLERHAMPKGAAPSATGKPEGHKRIESMRIMMKDRGGAVAATGTKGIVIADAVQRALDRFDATDANRDGTLSAEERKAARDARRSKGRTTAPALAKTG